MISIEPVGEGLAPPESAKSKAQDTERPRRGGACPSRIVGIKGMGFRTPLVGEGLAPPEKNRYMNYFNHPIRKPTRLKSFDYSSARAYFITICTFDRECTLSEIADNRVHLTAKGEVCERQIHDLPLRYSDISIDEYVIMPNHIHMIIVIRGANRTFIDAKPCRGGACPSRMKHHATDGARIPNATVGEGFTPPEQAVQQGQKSQTEHFAPTPPGRSMDAAHSRAGGANRTFAPTPPGRSMDAAHSRAGGASPSPTVSDIVRVFKSLATRSCECNGKLFQRSFHDHIIRNETDYEMIKNYIQNNPLNWQNDCFNSAFPGRKEVTNV